MARIGHTLLASGCDSCTSPAFVHTSGSPRNLTARERSLCGDPRLRDSIVSEEFASLGDREQDREAVCKSFPGAHDMVSQSTFG